jgi:uncharacterized protein
MTGADQFITAWRTGVTARRGIAMCVTLFAALLLTPGTAHAQFSDSYNFLKAVRDRDGNEATKLLNENTTTLINTRDKSNGETGLIIAVRRQDATWTNYLLSKGANPNLADKEGLTPLMHATMLGFADGAETLIKRGANVDQVNSRGETALILAVQTRNPGLVRLLIDNKANPDRSDRRATMRGATTGRARCWGCSMRGRRATANCPPGRFSDQNSDEYPLTITL